MNSCSSHAGGIRGLLPQDSLFIAMAALYAWLILHGIIAISASGAILDSDLQTYAQGMAGVSHPDLFKADPVLKSVSEANSIPNAQRMLAVMLSPPDAPQVGLLRAGVIAIFCFYVFWYALGRMLFGYPALAASLALLAGITVWVGWGTFWGVTHSDPVPRVFFAAVYPLLLMLAIKAISHPWLRPVAMLCAGLGMWVHGINALNCGAMFFMAFLFIKPRPATWKKHFRNCALCLLFFAIPVLIFLWPSLAQTRSFSEADLALFNELFAMRWQADYSAHWQRLAKFFSPTGHNFLLVLSGAICWIFVSRSDKGPIKILCRMCPFFLLALCLVTIFCWAESTYATALGRVSMGHELVRGLRYLIPLSWIMITGVAALVPGKIFRGLTLCLLLAGILAFTTDRQYEAAQYAVYELTGIPLPLAEKAKAEKYRAEKYRDLMENIKAIVPSGETVFSEDEDMAIRYLAMRPLSHTFKDGYVFFYNKDAEGSRQWVEYEKILHSPQGGLMRAWEKSGARWILLHEANKGLLGPNIKIAYDKNGWILACRDA